MPPTDALQLVNMVSKGLYVETRAPFEYLGSPEVFDRVHSLIPHYGNSANKLLAGDGTAIKEISTGTASTVGTGFSGDPWQFTAFNALTILTGGGTAQSYNGSTLTALVTTGLAPADMWGCNTYKGRVYYWKKNDDSFWYAAAGAYQGPLAEFPLDTQLSRGGYLVSMVSMTMDSGAGADDLAAFIFSTGEVLIYQGDDPATASSWALVGKYLIPIPLGIRANIRIGADAIVMTRRGYVSLNAIMAGDSKASSYMSSKISRLVNDLVNTYNTDSPADDQSDAVYCSKLNEVIFIHRSKLTGAVGDTESSGIQQLPRFSMESGTWFLGQPRLISGDAALHHAIAEFDGGLYMSVRAENTGVVDVVTYSDGTGSEDILITAQTAFSQQAEGGKMRLQAVAYESSAQFTAQADMAKIVDVWTNYEIAPTAYPNNGLISSGDVNITPWKSIAQFGTSFSVSIRAKNVSALRWYKSRVLLGYANPTR